MEISKWYRLLSKEDPIATEQIVINAGLRAKSSAVRDYNLDVMYGIEQKDQGDSKPLLAISAPYDSFGSAPNLPSGYESSISPILGLLHMSRVFKREF